MSFDQSPVVRTSLTGPNQFSIADGTLVRVFDKLPQSEQRSLVDTLKKFIDAVEADGSASHLAKLGMDPARIPSMSPKEVKAHLVENLYWQHCQFLRYSTPSRIAEAAHGAKFVLDHFNRINKGAKKDCVPMFYYASAIAKQPGKADEALAVFKEAFANAATNPHLGPQSQLWAQANMARLLRRMGRTSEAEKAEGGIKAWVLGHPYGMPPSQFKSVVTDDNDDAPNPILEDPEIKNYLGSANELGGGITMFNF